MFDIDRNKMIAMTWVDAVSDQTEAAFAEIKEVLQVDCSNILEGHGIDHFLRVHWYDVHSQSLGMYRRQRGARDWTRDYPFVQLQRVPCQFCVPPDYTPGPTPLFYACQISSTANDFVQFVWMQQDFTASD